MAHLRILVISTVYYLTRYYTLAGYCENDNKNGKPVNVPADQYCCTAKVYVNRVAFRYVDCSHKGGCCGDDDDHQICCDNYLSPVTLGLGCTAGAVVLLIIIFTILGCVMKKDFKANNKECHCTGCWCEVRHKPERYTYSAEEYSSSLAAGSYRQTDLVDQENTQRSNYWEHQTSTVISRLPESSDGFEHRETFPSDPPIPLVPSDHPAAPPPSYEQAVDMPRNPVDTTEDNPPKYVDAVHVYGIIV